MATSSRLPATDAGANRQRGRGTRRVSRLITATIVMASLVAVGVTSQLRASASTTPTPATAGVTGYQEVASDGGIFAFGSASFDGSTGAEHLNRPIVGMAATPNGLGYWLVASDGGIFTFGDAKFYGSTGAEHLNRPIVGMAATPDGGGYWLVASDGGIFAFGDAKFYGSTGAEHLNQPIVGMAATPDGGGYWLVASDGGIFTFGDASFHGSTGSMRLNQPIVGIAATPDGGGYWLVASDGGIFTLGDASFHGSTGSMRLNRPIVGIAATADGGGYWLVASDGGIFTFGDASFHGSTGGMALNQPIVGMAAEPSSGGATSFLSSRTEVVYGSSSSFGLLSSTSSLPGGQSVAVDAVPGWGFLPGQAVMGAVLGPDGSIVMGDEPQTSNQAEATATTMALSVFNPSTQTFQNVVIPTSTGATSVTPSGSVTGGADIAALASVPDEGNDVAFMSAWPYRGATTNGQYPTFGYVAPTGSGSYHYVAGSGRLASQIGASDPAACNTQATQPLTSCRGPVSMAVLPGSGDIVVAQYYDNEQYGADSGALMVLSPSGNLLASYAYPNVTNSSGAPEYVLPREVDVDPTSTTNDERFAVVFDVFDGANATDQGAFTLQTFRFDAATGSIAPESAPILPGQTVGGRTAYFETAHFDKSGNLWAAESVERAISGGNIVEYSAASVRGRLTSGACSAQPSWNSTQWGMTCAPDLTLTGAAGQGDVRSITEDTATGAIYFATISSDLIPVTPTGNASAPWVEGTSFDFGINQIVDRTQSEILPRQGVLDPTTGYLWLPVEQLQSSSWCNFDAATFTCQNSPAPLSQWLVRINVGQLGG